MDMEPRERVLAALARREPDKVPKALSFYRVDLAAIAPPGCTEDDLGLEVRFVEFEPSRAEQRFHRYIQQFPMDTRIGSPSQLRTYSEWSYQPDDEIQRNPLAKAETVADLADYPWPDITAEYRYRGLKKEVERWQGEGYAVAGGPPHLGGELFETAWRLRGLENFLLDLICNKALAHALLDRLADLCQHNAVVLAEAGVDILVLDDDVGMPTTMIISPAMWREFLGPRLAGIIRAAQSVKPDLRILYHSDGYFKPIIADLIEMGVDAINPVQPDVMDPLEIKKRYGDRVALWGTVGAQTTFAFATPEEIRREVRLRIETLGRAGLVLCPAYDIDEPDIPWENILAFLEAAEEYGSSPK
jgi:uroporphyrinogen decarboxylase